MKQSCDTRWSSNHEAVGILADYTKEIIEILEVFRVGLEETSETKGDAGSL